MILPVIVIMLETITKFPALLKRNNLSFLPYFKHNFQNNISLVTKIGYVYVYCGNLEMWSYRKAQRRK